MIFEMSHFKSFKKRHSIPVRVEAQVITNLLFMTLPSYQQS